MSDPEGSEKRRLRQFILQTRASNIVLEPTTKTLIDRFSPENINRLRLIEEQRKAGLKPVSEKLKKEQKKKKRKARRTKQLRGEVARAIREQTRFERGERRDKPGEEPIIVGEPRLPFPFPIPDPTPEIRALGENIRQQNLRLHNQYRQGLAQQQIQQQQNIDEIRRRQEAQDENIRRNFQLRDATYQQLYERLGQNQVSMAEAREEILRRLAAQERRLVRAATGVDRPADYDEIIIQEFKRQDPLEEPIEEPIEEGIPPTPRSPPIKQIPKEKGYIGDIDDIEEGLRQLTKGPRSDSSNPIFSRPLTPEQGSSVEEELRLTPELSRFKYTLPGGIPGRGPRVGGVGPIRAKRLELSPETSAILREQSDLQEEFEKQLQLSPESPQPEPEDPSIIQQAGAAVGGAAVGAAGAVGRAGMGVVQGIGQGIFERLPAAEDVGSFVGQGIVSGAALAGGAAAEGGRRVLEAGAGALGYSDEVKDEPPPIIPERELRPLDPDVLLEAVEEAEQVGKVKNKGQARIQESQRVYQNSFGELSGQIRTGPRGARSKKGGLGYRLVNNTDRTLKRVEPGDVVNLIGVEEGERGEGRYRFDTQTAAGTRISLDQLGPLIDDGSFLFERGFRHELGGHFNDEPYGPPVIEGTGGVEAASGELQAEQEEELEEGEP